MLSRDNLNKLAEIELLEASIKHETKFSSMEQGFFVIYEEYAETLQELKHVKDSIQRLWLDLRHDGINTETRLEELEEDTYKLIAEALQLYAMAKKGKEYVRHV